MRNDHFLLADCWRMASNSVTPFGCEMSFGTTLKTEHMLPRIGTFHRSQQRDE